MKYHEIPYLLCSVYAGTSRVHTIPCPWAWVGYTPEHTIPCALRVPPTGLGRVHIGANHSVRSVCAPALQGRVHNEAHHLECSAECTIPSIDPN